MSRYRVRAATDLRWVEKRAPCVLTRDARGIEAVDADDRIVGMVAFDGWTPSSAQLHVAIEEPMAVLALRRPVFRYLFEECAWLDEDGRTRRGKSVAVGVLRERNHHALQFDRALGFVNAGRLVDGWDKGEDLILLEMRKENCRWLKARG